MDWLRLSLSGIFCFSFILMGLYSAHAELMHYWNNRDKPSEHLTSLGKVRRRILTSLILIAVMVLIFAGVNFIKFTEPGSYLLFWGICSFFAMFLFVLPLIDMKETVRMGGERKKMLYKEFDGIMEKDVKEI